MGLNLSNGQIAKELGLDKDDVQKMTTQLRQRIVDSKGEVQLSGEVECDEVYVTAGHKGNPDAVKKKDDRDGLTASKEVEVEVRLRKKNRQFSA
jgi:DNA-directed RNA polymerase specialized sigma subunit